MEKINKQLGYSATGVNACMNIYQFQCNGVGDFYLPKLWWEIMDMGGCLDAPESIHAGSCINAILVEKYISR